MHVGGKQGLGPEAEAETEREGNREAERGDPGHRAALARRGQQTELEREPDLEHQQHQTELRDELHHPAHFAGLIAQRGRGEERLPELRCEGAQQRRAEGETGEHFADHPGLPAAHRERASQACGDDDRRPLQQHEAGNSEAADAHAI